MNNVQVITDVQVTDCTPTGATKLARVNFFNRQLLTADDMTTERDYFLQKLRRHNRFMHGWGVVCGLAVTAAPTSTSPWRVQVGSGYALGPYGDEIFVGDAVYFDLAACTTGGTTNPCEPNMVTSGGAGTRTTAYLAIKYAECLARPVQVASSGCGCDNDPCQYSRILDSFQLQCLAQLPPAPAEPPSLCKVNSGTLAGCPPCPTQPWVVLARITLPSASKTEVAQSAIETSVRPLIVSTAILQAQLISCCCGKQPPPPPTVSLKSILVRTSAIPGTQGPTGGLGNAPTPAGPWTETSAHNPLVLPAPDAVFDFQLNLTGDAPSGGFAVNITSVLSSSLGTLHLTAPPFIVPEGKTQSSAYTGSSVATQQAGESNMTVTVTLTATAADNPANSVTATLSVLLEVNPK